jgi:hypothetical protein
VVVGSDALAEGEGDVVGTGFCELGIAGSGAIGDHQGDDQCGNQHYCRGRGDP